MYSEHTTLDLVANIYDAVNDETLWPTFLEKLAGTLHSTATNLFVQDLRHPGGAASATFGIDPAFVRSYADYYGKVNIFLIRRRGLLKAGSVCFSDELCPNEEAIRSEFFNDWVLPQGQGHGLLGTIFNDDSVAGNIGTIRARATKPFSVADKRFLQSLMPHLQRAVALKRRMAHLEALQQNTSSALDRWSLGVVLVDRQGRVMLANWAAEEIFRQNDGLSVEVGSLRTKVSQETLALRTAIHGAMCTTNGRGSHPGAAFTISRRSLKRPLNLLVSPMSSEQGMFAKQGAAAVIFIGDPEFSQTTDRVALRRFYGLSRAEADVAALLVEGRSVRDVSDELFVSRNTVRTHLKRIFDKTGTKRQAELARLPLKSPISLRRAA